MKLTLPSIFLTILFFLFISCTTKTANKDKNKSDTLSVVGKDRIVNSLGETLTPTAKKEVKDWVEYKELDKFLVSYYAISKNEALLNAKELTALVKQLKDSIRVEALNIPQILARINVLENEVLRLEDMTSISTINFEEVSEEVNSILKVYEAFKAKINTIYKAKALQEALEIDTEEYINTESIETTKLDRRKSKLRRKKGIQISSISTNN